MSKTSNFFKTIAILSTALLSLLGACAIDDPIDYTTNPAPAPAFASPTANDGEQVSRATCDPSTIVNQSEVEGMCVSGRIISAVDTSPASCVEVCVGESCTFTDQNGNYSVSATNADNQTINLVASGEHYATYENNFEIENSEQCYEENISISPALEDGQRRFVLTWGAMPRDLDSHLKLPTGSQVYYSNRAAGGANLDVDDTSSYGPETITLNQLTNSGVHKYYIYNFSRDSTSFSNADARISVYDNESTEIISPNQGAGHYWHVLNVNAQGEIEIINQIRSTAP